MNENSLFEILAILIGFAGIMLILSLFVTALTQSLLYILSIRAGNLQAGLEELLATAQEQGVDPTVVHASRDCEAKRTAEVEAKAIVASLKDQQKAPPKEIAEAEGKLAKAALAYKEAKMAGQKLEASKAAPEQGSEDSRKREYDPAELAEKILNSNSLMRQGKIRRLPQFMAPRASWILRDELELLLHEHKALSAETIGKVMSWFSRMERGLSQRFNIIARCITLVLALLVGVVFQVSAPDVLKRLSTDAQYRARAEMAATNLLNKYEGSYPEQIRYDAVSAEALAQLQGKHPELQETLEEVSGIGSTKGDILKELSVVLEDHPHRETLLNEYELTLDKLHRKGYEQAAKMVQESVGALASFDIVPFSQGSGFYGRPSNWLGILMTTVLISLGAPFWFTTLRRLVSLRDALKPKEDKKAKD